MDGWSERWFDPIPREQCPHSLPISYGYSSGSRTDGWPTTVCGRCKRSVYVDEEWGLRYKDAHGVNPLDEMREAA